MAIRVAIVPHTHWDREWEEPFQSLRVRLVALCDELLDHLEADASSQFLLDGQTALIDDYLEVRPDAAPRLGRLVEGGQLHVGPWAVLMDEFLVSGETIVRNLQLGLARVAELGGTADVGYLPDMFGHIAQMPQLLTLAGLRHAVVWRGVPETLDRTAFRWCAPDGSGVRAEYLYGSYANGRDLGREGSDLVARARSYELELGDVRLPDGGLLLMDGGDRSWPERGLATAVAAANAAQEDYVFEVTSLGAYLDAQPVTGLPTWSGELRSSVGAPLLMGIASNRVDVHRARFDAEQALERTAEPLNALFRTPEAYPDRLLDLGWRLLILNSAHDSAGACSVDEVVDTVLTRHQEARQIGETLAADALRDLAQRIDAPVGSFVVVNPTQRARGGVVSIDVPVTGPSGATAVFVDDDGAQCLLQLGPILRRDGLVAVVSRSKIRWVLDRIHADTLAGLPVAEVTNAELAPGEWTYTFRSATPGEPTIDLATTSRELLELAESGATLRIHQLRAPTRTVDVYAPDVPGFGWRTLRPVEAGPTSTPVRRGANAGERVLENELVRVTVDVVTGTFGLRTTDGIEVEGLDRLVDGGDGGDTYNYSPPTTDLLVETPISVRVSVLEPGPVRARLLVERRYQLPVAAIGDAHSCTTRADERTPVDVRTVLELRPGEPFVRVRTELDHHIRDHRLRAHFPLPAPVDGSDAECAYAVVHRGLDAESGPQEHGLPTFPSRRFVDCSDGPAGLAILHRGLHEYEVTNEGHELAVTILRATGYLSRSQPLLRPVPAGPLLPVEGAQIPGHYVAEYAVLLHRGDWSAAACHEHADAFAVDLAAEVVTGPPTTRTDAFPAAGHALSVEGAPVSALRREHGRLLVRLYNPRSVSVTATVATDGTPGTGRLVNLVGREIGSFDGSVVLGPAEIVTVELDERPGARGSGDGPAALRH